MSGSIVVSPSAILVPPCAPWEHPADYHARRMFGVQWYGLEFEERSRLRRFWDMAAKFRKLEATAPSPLLQLELEAVVEVVEAVVEEVVERGA